MDGSLNSGKMEFSLGFTNVAEGIFTILHLWILINVSHTYGESIKSVIKILFKFEIHLKILPYITQKNELSCFCYFIYAFSLEIWTVNSLLTLLFFFPPINVIFYLLR